MRKYFCVALFFLGTASVSLAQVDSAKATNSTYDSIEVVSKDLDKRLDFFLVDLNWDYLLGMPNLVDQKLWGRGITLNAMFDQPLNQKSNVSLAVGVGFQSSNYYTDSYILNDTMAGADISTWITPITTDADPSTFRQKISVNYVDVPFEVRFRTNPNSKGYRWKVYVGGKVGYMFQAHEKLIDQNDFKVKYYDYPTINRWRYGISTRLGYGSVAITGFYSLSTLFNNNHTQGQQNALSLGITLIPF
jgi:hypothetical protein